VDARRRLSHALKRASNIYSLKWQVTRTAVFFATSHLREAVWETAPVFLPAKDLIIVVLWLQEAALRMFHISENPSNFSITEVVNAGKLLV